VNQSVCFLEVSRLCCCVIARLPRDMYHPALLKRRGSLLRHTLYHRVDMCHTLYHHVPHTLPSTIASTLRRHQGQPHQFQCGCPRPVQLVHVTTGGCSMARTRWRFSMSRPVQIKAQTSEYAHKSRRTKVKTKTSQDKNKSRQSEVKTKRRPCDTACLVAIYVIEDIYKIILSNYDTQQLRVRHHAQGRPPMGVMPSSNVQSPCTFCRGLFTFAGLFAQFTGLFSRE